MGERYAKWYQSDAMRPKGLSYASKWLYAVLRSFADNDTGECHPSCKKLMDVADMPRPTLMRCLKELEEAGLLTRCQDPGKPTVYVIPPVSDVIPVSPVIPVSKTTRKQPKVVSPAIQSSIKNDVAYKEEEIHEEIQKKRSMRARKTAHQESAEYLKIRNFCYETFCAKYTEAYETPYQKRAADFKHLHELLKNCQSNKWELTPERWEQALSHYFASEMGKHTLAALAADFSTFYRASLDRFKQPIHSHNGTVLPPKTAGNLAAGNSFIINSMKGGFNDKE
jgi:Helix-turn-helix domain